MVGCLDDRCGQGLLVHLLVLVQRNGVNLHRSGRNHVRRLLLADEGIEILDVHLLVADDIGSDILAAVVVVEGLDGDILHAGILTDDGLDLLQLDAEAANLHLSVLTSDELDVAIGQIAHDVAGAVDACKLLLAAERIVDIHLGGLLRTVQIASGDVRTTDPQLAHSTLRQTVELLVDDVEARVVERCADRDVLQQLVHLILRDEDGTFRRTVAVVQLEVLRGLQRCQFLTGSNQVQQRVIVVVGSKLISDLRRHERVGDVVFLEVGVHLRQRQTNVVTDDIDTRTARQCRIEVHHTAVEAVTGIARHMVLSLQFEAPLIPVAECCQVVVLQLTTLGQTRRTRGIEQDVQVGGVGLHIDGLAGYRQLLDVLRQQHLTVVFAHHVAQRLVGDEQFGGGILDHEVQALLRIARVERLVGTSGLQHTQCGNRHPLAARNDNRHDVFLAKSPSDEHCRNALRQVVHLAIGVLVLVIDHSHIVRCELHLTTEQRDNGLGVVVRHLGIVEAVQQGDLPVVEQGDALDGGFGLTDESIGRIADRLRQALHQLAAVASVVVLQTDARLALGVVLDEESDAELGRIRLEGINVHRLTFVLVFGKDAQLIGKQDFGREVVVGRDACKRIRLVL